MIEHDMACTVCTYAIDDNGTVTYELPGTPTGGDHDPAPVPAHQLADVCRRCHLCSANEPMWMYRTPQIEAVSQGTHSVRQTYSTQWSICVQCAAIIEDDHVALTQRSIAVMGWHPADPRSQLLGILHRAIVLMREPGRTLLTTGASKAAPLKAATLPKVRDRLAELVRSTVELPAPLDNIDTRALLADGLDQARLYWIDAEFTALAGEVLADLPNTAVTDRIAPTGSGLLVWSTPIDQRHRIAATSWTPQLGGWQMVCYRSLGLDLPPTTIETVRREIGWLVPIHVAYLSREAVVNGDDPLAGLIATWLIIAQQLTQDEPTPVDPPSARRTPAPTGHYPRSGLSASNRPAHNPVQPTLRVTAPRVAGQNQIIVTGSPDTRATRHTDPAAASVRRSTLTRS